MHLMESPDCTLVFADGACSGNPGPGGWGVVIVTPAGDVTELGGRKESTTNNKMELTAVGFALRHLEHSLDALCIYSDSKYVIEGMTNWISGWEKNNWKKADGKPVANIAYWKRLQELVSGRSQSVEWKYVPGHSGVPGNERCDEIAQGFAQGDPIELYHGPLDQYSVRVLEITYH